MVFGTEALWNIAAPIRTRGDGLIILGENAVMRPTASTQLGGRGSVHIGEASRLRRDNSNQASGAGTVEFAYADNVRLEESQQTRGAGSVKVSGVIQVSHPLDSLVSATDETILFSETGEPRQSDGLRLLCKDTLTAGTDARCVADDLLELSADSAVVIDAPNTGRQSGSLQLHGADGVALGSAATAEVESTEKEETEATFAYATLADGDATNDVPAISFSGTVTPAGSRVYMAYLPTGVKITDVTEEALKTAMMYLTNNTTDDEESEIYADSDSDGNWAVDVGTVKSSGTYVAVVFGTDTSIEMTAKAQRNWNGEYIAAKIVGLDTGLEYTIDLSDYESNEDYSNGAADGSYSSALNGAMLERFVEAIEDMISEGESSIVIYGEIILEMSSEWAISMETEYDLNCFNITIASSPNADDTTEGNNVAGEVENLFEYSKLTIIGDLNFGNTLLVAGNQQAGSPLSGALTGSYGALEIKDGTLTLDGGTLYARGKVYGDGEIVNWGTIYQPFIIHDWPGLVKALGVNNAGVFPFSLYEFYNMEIRCTNYDAVEMYGQMCVEYADSGETLSREITVLANGWCLFNSDSEGNYVGQTMVFQRVDGVQKITAEADLQVNYISINIYGMSSENMVTPFGYNLEIELPDESAAVVYYTSLKLLPGFKLTGNLYQGNLRDWHSENSDAIAYIFDKDSYSAAYNAAGWMSESETEITSPDTTGCIAGAATTDATTKTLLAITNWDMEDAEAVESITLNEYVYENDEVESMQFYYYV